MKKNLKTLSVFTMIIMFVIIGVSPVQAATKASLKSKLERATDQTIRKFYYTDLNNDGKKEAVGITSKEEDEFGYVEANMWYVSGSRCTLFETCKLSLYPETIRFYKVKGTKMLCCSSGAGGSGWHTYAWVFDKNGAKKVENAMAGVYQMKGNEFAVFDSRFDALVDGIGHTWNQYYSKWDGKKLVEYGGLEISQSQLKKAKNGSKILKEVKKYGEVQSMYYRANGMIFINLCDGYSNTNVALKLKNGKLAYYDYGNGGETSLQKATGEGVIYKSITSCVKYPKKFPLD